MIKFVLTLAVGIVIGLCLTLHMSKDVSAKDIAETQQTTRKTEATAASVAHKAEVKGAKVYEALKSDDDETKVSHTDNGK